MKRFIKKMLFAACLIIDTLYHIILGSHNGRIGNAKLNWHTFINF